MLTDDCVLIRLKHFVLVVNQVNNNLYLYPLILFNQTELTWRTPTKLTSQFKSVTDSVINIISDDNESIKEPAVSLDSSQVSLESSQEDGPDDSAALSVQLPWPIDKSLLVQARLAILADEDRHSDEQSIIQQLAQYKKVGIIQLTLDDANFLFARRIFDEIISFEELSKY
jgi:hypothetical protein